MSQAVMSPAELSTEKHFSNSSPAFQARLNEFRQHMYSVLTEGAFQSVRSSADGGVSARPPIQNMPGTIWDKNTKQYSNPAISAPDMVIKDTPFGATVARQITAVTRLVASVIAHGQEEKRLFAGVAINNCSPGGYVGVRLA